jgi:ATP-dependent Lon protease
MNEPKNICTILLNRMTVLKLNGYDCKEKIYILDNNVIPAIKK